MHNVTLGNLWSHSDALSPARFPHPRSERHRPLPLGERRVQQQLHAGRHARPRPCRGHHRGSRDAGVSHRAAEHPRVGAAPSAAGEYITASGIRLFVKLVSLGPRRRFLFVAGSAQESQQGQRGHGDRQGGGLAENARVSRWRRSLQSHHLPIRASRLQPGFHL